MSRENLILTVLQFGNYTANESINSIYFQDLKNGIKRDGWKFYVHVNKDFAPLERRGLIMVVGHKKGPTGKIEKVWSLTKFAKENFQSLAA